jgi:3-hydroxyisobutyrate dehydrogenase
MAMKVAVAGLGMIGGGVARGLLASGYEVVGYDVRPEAFESFAGGIEVAATPAELADAATVLFVAVYDDAQLRDFLAGSNGVLSAEHFPEILIILSTVTTETVRWAAEEAERRGGRVLDCGVSGGAAIERREMVTMVGGDAEAFEAAKPFIASFSPSIFHMGLLGAGMQTKIARNMYHFVTRVAAWESVQLAAAAGVEPHAFLDVLKACAVHSGPFDLLDRGIGWPSPPEVDEETRRRSGLYAHKDLKVAFQLGEEVGVEVPLARVTEGRYDAAVQISDQGERLLA